MQLSSVLTPTGRWWRNGKMDFEILKPEVIEQKLKEIVLQSSNGTSTDQRQDQLYELLVEINAIVKHAKKINCILLRGDKQSENDPTLNNRHYIKQDLLQRLLVRPATYTFSIHPSPF
jgi:hypothetical protein